MIKAIFFDVDGTLVSHTTNSVSESTRAALDALSQKGIRRILATGRHMLELAMLPVKDIVFDGYVTLNGQLCLDAARNVISENPITGEAKDCLLRLFAEKQIPIVLVEKDRLYINFVNRQVEIAQHAVSTPIPETGAYTGNPIYLAVAYVDKGSEDTVLRHLSGCKATRWNDYGVDIVADSGGKVAGIKEYLHFSHTLQSETMAFGDGENDMDMLKFVHLGVAMGNADPLTKESADHVTASVDDDGITKALSFFGILDGSTL